MNTAAKNFDILVDTQLLFAYIIILKVQNYFSDLYSAKILDFSVKSFFPYNPPCKFECKRRCSHACTRVRTAELHGRECADDRV